MVTTMNPEMCNVCGGKIEGQVDECPFCKAVALEADKRVFLPPPKGAVNDFFSALSDEQERELAKLVEGFYERTGVPLVLATVKTARPLTPNEYAFMLYNYWGIGDARTNRGILILLCMDERHLESEIGLGLEEIFPEEVGDRIVKHEFIPYLSNNDYFGGLKAGAQAIINYLEKKIPRLT